MRSHQYYRWMELEWQRQNEERNKECGVSAYKARERENNERGKVPKKGNVNNTYVWFFFGFFPSLHSHSSPGIDVGLYVSFFAHTYTRVTKKHRSFWLYIACAGFCLKSRREKKRGWEEMNVKNIRRRRRRRPTINLKLAPDIWTITYTSH